MIMGTKNPIVLFLIVHVMMNVFLALSSTNLRDQSALRAFKDQISSDSNNIFAKNWSDGTSVCNWVGVSCSLHDQRVTALNLPNVGLSGTIPKEIGNLSFLISFNISNNYFHGHLPDELGHLHRLKSLDFQFNGLSGDIPASISFLTKLQYMFLSYNNFTGSIPQAIGDFTNLEMISLRNNSISGFIPSTIFNISSLQRIDFKFNKLSGILPVDTCTHLPLLEIFVVSGNQLSGEMPSSLSKCGELRKLSLWGNQFTGNIPKAMGNLTKLEELYLYGNNFNGPIPTEISDLSNLKMLSLHSNKLTGTIPFAIFNISSLQEIRLGNNSLYGTLPTEMCNNLPKLEGLNLAENQLTGPIPTSLPRCGEPDIISLYSNQFTGSIPGGIGNLTKLRDLYLGRNRLTEHGSSGIVSTEGDVYSYGILLMETFTRKKPTDDLFVEELSMKQWVSESLPNAVLEVVDSNLLTREDENFTAKEKCLSMIMELALECTMESLEERINMKDALVRLEKIKAKMAEIA